MLYLITRGLWALSVTCYHDYFNLKKHFAQEKKANQEILFACFIFINNNLKPK